VKRHTVVRPDLPSSLMPWVVGFVAAALASTPAAKADRS
jgi:hypothetical protein